MPALPSTHECSDTAVRDHTDTATLGSSDYALGALRDAPHERSKMCLCWVCLMCLPIMMWPLEEGGGVSGLVLVVIWPVLTIFCDLSSLIRLLRHRHPVSAPPLCPRAALH